MSKIPDDLDKIKLKQCMSRFPRSKIWDETTQRGVDAMRAHLHRQPQPTISEIQRGSLKERPVDDTFHSVRHVLSAPTEDDARQLLFRAIDELGEIEYLKPNLTAVPVEWVGKKSSSSSTSGGQSSLNGLTSNSTSDLTIFHVHGGAFFQGSPGAYRPTTTKLAELTGGRVVSIEYRLAPAHPFPAGLLDVFIAYLSLLYPSPSSAHEALAPSRVVFTADSSGAVLLFNILQLIQHTSSFAPIRFNSHKVTFPLPYPAGLAAISLVGDQLGCLPSYTENRVNDLFLDLPWSLPGYPSCSLWPANDPPRSQIYANASAYSHPLVNVALAKSWQGAPPLWFAFGEEQYLDGGKSIARRAAQQGVKVDYMIFEAMPHCFAALPGLNRKKQAQILWSRWAEFCKDCVQGSRKQNREQSVKATRVGFKDALEVEIPLEDPTDLSCEEIDQRMLKRVGELDLNYKYGFMPFKL